MLPHVTYETDPYAVARGAEAVAIVTEWDAYRALDLERLGNAMAVRRLVDLRNIYQPEQVARAGFEYFSVGR